MLKRTFRREIWRSCIKFSIVYLRHITLDEGKAVVTFVTDHDALLPSLHGVTSYLHKVQLCHMAKNTHIKSPVLVDGHGMPVCANVELDCVVFNIINCQIIHQ